MLQNVLLAPEVRVVEADPGSALHTDGVHPKTYIIWLEQDGLLGKVDFGSPKHPDSTLGDVSRSQLVNMTMEFIRIMPSYLFSVRSPVHEATILEVVTLSSDLQLPAGETFSLIEGNLEEINTALFEISCFKSNSKDLMAEIKMLVSPFSGWNLHCSC